MNDKALKLIRPFLKRDQIVASFKEAILSGTIQPGASIVESKVAQQLGAGIPLRDSISDWRTEVFNSVLPRESE